ncbi:MAG: BPL-N domain-containing protein [Patescibacteria group bacterium]
MTTFQLYVGDGAYQAKDIENLLCIRDSDYARVCEHGLDDLPVPGIFIVPGGSIARIRDALSPHVQAIRSFVEKGGVYVGICAGAFVAGEKCLGFYPGEAVSHPGVEFVPVTTTDGRSFELVCENKPDLRDVSGSILLQDRQSARYAIQFEYGKGLVCLLSGHPEGSIYHKRDPHTELSAAWFMELLEKYQAGFRDG